MKAKLIRTTMYLIAGGALLALTGCSALSNGYGGWYWQTAEISNNNGSPASATQTASSSSTHMSKSERSGSQQG